MPFPWLAAAVAAGAGLGAWGSHRANKANQASARESMAFQERMSNTAQQRGMADMREAGLNPMLVGRFGGASTPGGSQFTSQNELSEAANSAKGFSRDKVELDILKSDATIKKWDATMAQYQKGLQTSTMQAQKNLLLDQAAAVQASTAGQIQSAVESAARTRAIEAMLPGQHADSKFKSGLGGEVSRWLGVAGQGAHTALEFKNLLSPPKGLSLDPSKFGLFSKGTGEIFNP